MFKRFFAVMLSVAALFAAAPASAFAQSAPVFSGGTLITLGDSLTAIGEWPQRVATALNMKLVNSGIGGDTAEDVSVRFERDVTEKIIPGKETFLTVGLGTNDFTLNQNGEKKVSVQRYGALLRGFADRARELGVHVILLTPPIMRENVYNDVGKYPEGSYRAALGKYAQEVRSVAAEKQTGLIDMFALTENFSTEPGAFLGPDGVHFAEVGKQFYTDTVIAYFRGHFTEDFSVPAVPQPQPPQKQRGFWEKEWISHNPEDWFVLRQGTMTVQREADGSISFANTNGQWPEAHYSPVSDKTLAVPYRNTFVRVRISAKATTNFYFYYNGANPTVGYDRNDVAMVPVLKRADPSIRTDAVSGDIIGGQEIDVRVKISDFIPANAADEDGFVVLSGMKIYAVGAAGQKVTIHEISVSHPDPATLSPDELDAVYEDKTGLMPDSDGRISRRTDDKGVADWKLGADGSLTISRAESDKLGWPSVIIDVRREIDLAKTPAVHLAVSTAGGGSANGLIHFTDSAGKTHTQQLSAGVNGGAYDFTADTDAYFNLAKASGVSGKITVDTISLSVYGVPGASVCWTTLAMASETYPGSGDLNGDGETNIHDAQDLFDALNGALAQRPDASVSDLNEDGERDIADVLVLYLRVAGDNQNEKAAAA